MIARGFRFKDIWNILLENENKSNHSDFSENIKLSERKDPDARLIMTKKKDDNGMCISCGSPSGCRVEAILGVDERGQMVLPKDVRERAGIQTGEKLALISCEKDGKVCCLALMKAGDLSGMVRGILGPLLGEQD